METILRYKYSDDYLEHHGIKGMKWGVRRYQKADGTLTRAGKRHQVKQQAEKKRQAYKSMSDDELRKAVNRLNMEAQYRKLTKPNKKGEQFVKNSLAVATSVAAATGTALTIYNNSGKIAKIARQTANQARKVPSQARKVAKAANVVRKNKRVITSTAVRVIT